MTVNREVWKKTEEGQQNDDDYKEPMNGLLDQVVEDSNVNVIF